MSRRSNTGPEMRLDDLPEGEQIVTTIKREKIKPPEKKDSPLPGIIVGIIALSLLFKLLVEAEPQVPTPYPVPVEPYYPPQPLPCYPNEPTC